MPLDLNFVLENKSKFNLTDLRRNNKLSWDFIVEFLVGHPDEQKFEVSELLWCSETLQKTFNWELLEKYPHWNWCIRTIMIKCPIPWIFVKKYPKKFKGEDLCRSNILWDLLEDVLTSQWDINEMSRRCVPPIELIIRNPEFAWNLTELSEKTSWEIIEKYPNFKWNMGILSNRGPPWEFVDKFPNWGWNMDQLSKFSPSWEFVKRHFNLGWNLKLIMSKCYRDVPYDLVLEHPTADWNWRYITLSAPPEFIIQNPILPWDWYYLGYNEQLMDAFPNADWNICAISK